MSDAEPEYECANCGAAYHGRGAALQCCSEDLRTDGGEDSEGDNRVDPENLPNYYTPAFIQVSEQGPVYVADYKTLESGWIRFTEWRGRDHTGKLPPHRVAAIRDVQIERYGERNDRGHRKKRVRKEKHRDQARPDEDEAQPVVADD